MFKILEFLILNFINASNRGKTEKLTITLTLSQTSPGFYQSAVQVFLKTLWEKETLLVMSNFYPFEELSAIFIKL